MTNQPQITAELIDFSCYVQTKGQKAITTSLDIAQVFKKQHKNVLQKVESLDCPQNSLS